MSRRGSKPCAMRSPGVTTSSPRRSRSTSSAWRSSPAVCETAGEDRQALEVDLLLRGEEVVTPGDRIAHGLLPRRDIAGASGQEWQPLLQTLQQRVRRKE